MTIPPVGRGSISFSSPTDGKLPKLIETVAQAISVVSGISITSVQVAAMVKNEAFKNHTSEDIAYQRIVHTIIAQLAQDIQAGRPESEQKQRKRLLEELNECLTTEAEIIPSGSLEGEEPILQPSVKTSQHELTRRSATEVTVTSVLEFMKQMQRIECSKRLPADPVEADALMAQLCGPLNAQESQYLELFIRSLERSDEALMHRLCQMPEFSPELAFRILFEIATHDIHTEIPPLNHLLAKLPMSVEALAVELASVSTNASSMACILRHLPDHQKACILDAVVFKLIDRNEGAQAQVLLELVIPKRGAMSGPSALAVLSVASNCAKWKLSSLFRPEKRFQSLSQETINDIVHTLLQSELVGILTAGQTLEMLKYNMQAVSSQYQPQQSSAMWLHAHKMPLELLSYKHCVDFFRQTNLHSLISYYGHVVTLDQKNRPCLRVLDQFTPMDEVLARFEVREGLREYMIIEKETGRRWTYLSHGLQPYDPETQMTPFAFGKPQQSHTITFYFMAEGGLSVSEIRHLSRHSWINLTKPDGSIYSVGHLGTGAIRSPDIFEYVHGRRKAVTFPVDETTFQRILSEIHSAQLNDTDAFNYLTNNCSSFAAKTASSLFDSLPLDFAPAVSIAQSGINTWTNRAGLAAISLIIAQFLIKRQPQLFQESLSSEEIANQILSCITDKELKKNGVVIPKEELISYLTTILRMIPEENLKKVWIDLIQNVQSQDTEALASKLYNLFTDVFQAASALTIDLPFVLFEKLSHMKQAKIEKFEGPVRHF